MEIFLRYLKLYTVNETLLSFSFDNLDENKRYVLAQFNNNNLIRLFINL